MADNGKIWMINKKLAKIGFNLFTAQENTIQQLNITENKFPTKSEMLESKQMKV